MSAHGVIWKDNPTQIFEKYLEWADNYQENQITLLYDTMWNNTKQMAEDILKGIKEKDEEVRVKLINTSNIDKNEVITEVFKSKAILVGSPTINNGILHSIAGILEMIEGLKFKNKDYAAFGSYGWSGESVDILEQNMDSADFNKVIDGIKVKWTPNEENIDYLNSFGSNFIKKLSNK